MFWPKALVRGILKMFLAIFLLGVTVWVVELVGMDSSAIQADIIKSTVGELPFLSVIGDIFGYGADAYDVAVNVNVHNGYGVLHDFSKSVMLFLIVHISFGFIKSACTLLGRGMSPHTPYAFIFQGLFDFCFGLLVCINSIILMCVLHHITLDWWISTFGSSSLSNWCYLIALVSLVAFVFIMLTSRRKSLLDSLGIMLTDFGLSLCVVLLGYCLLTARQDAAAISAILPTFLTFVVGLVILLGIRFRNI